MTQAYRVLAVDDDPDQVQLLKTMLSTLPLEIVHVHTGTEAIDFLNREVPDLMFLDVSLPDMHGWDVLDKFKHDARLRQSRIIILTSHKEPVHRVIGSLQPIAVYMNKPPEPDALRHQVRRLLNL